MKVAIVGASSQIAKDLIWYMSQRNDLTLLLYVRDKTSARSWLHSLGLKHLNITIHGYSEYGQEPHDVVINFVGVGDPQRAMDMGAKILDVTQEFDNLVLNQLQFHPMRKYIFLSSGAAYGSVFEEAAGEKTLARIDINNIDPKDYYGVAKLYAEVRHRSLLDSPIIDVRVFNYFSRTQDVNARFFIADIIRAIRSNQMLQTSSDQIIRDYIHPSDFYQLIDCLLRAPLSNNSIDCYSLKPITKLELLDRMKKEFGLNYEIVRRSDAIVNATNIKPNYYSANRKAAEYSYQPRLTSWDGIKKEATAIFDGFPHEKN